MSHRDNGVHYELRKFERIGTLTDSMLVTMICKLVKYVLVIHHEALYKRKIFFADYA